MIIYTIGFTKKTAEQFFEIIKQIHAKYLLDIRLNNTSQLAGFTKRNDIGYFLEHLTNIVYVEIPEFAPNKEILDNYQKTKNWPLYERQYLSLLAEREAEKAINPHFIEQGIVLLCSESKPDKCHRRLAAEYLRKAMGNDLIIKHL